MILPFAVAGLMLMQPPSRVPAAAQPATDPLLLTVVEASEYTATATSAQVIELLEHIHARSTVTRLSELGRTSEGKPIPLIILADPPITNAAEARRAARAHGDTGGAASGGGPALPPGTRAPGATEGKPIVFIMANIHAGEIEGKEAALMLAREFALNPGGGAGGAGGAHPLLKDLIIVIAPNYNADGNDRFDDVAKNRPGQDGPARVGVRPNAQNLDLNRDYIKLESPEAQALVRFFTEWDPHVTIDCHTTNGSAHRYVLTYDAPLNPSGHAAPINFIRNTLLPEVTKRVKERTGYEMWFYGNFNRARPPANAPTTWATYSAQPRFGGPYQGLRGQMSILAEAYSYAPYKDRTLATKAFLEEILKFVAEHKDEVLKIHEQARRETTERGRNPQPDDVVGIRHRIAAFPQPAIVKGWEQITGGEGGAAIDPHVDHGPPKDYPVVHLGRFEPTLSVARPFAYIIPPGFDSIIAKLRQHGIAVEPFTGRATVEAYTITAIDRARREFQGHNEVSVEADAQLVDRDLASGSFIVRTAQPLGTLAVYLLEPESEDGLVTWNFFDDHLREGGEFPVVRVRAERDLPAGAQ